MSSCYIMAAWTGPRRLLDPRAEKDPGFYVKTHLRQLRKLERNIDKIVIAYSGPHPVQLMHYIADTPPCRHEAPLEILARPNVGMSYGAWSEAFDEYPDYDYYFLVEDDYFPMMPGFDRVLISMLEADEKCAYVCGLNSRHMKDPVWQQIKPFAAIPQGCVKGEALRAIVKEHGHLPYSKVSIKSGSRLEYVQVEQEQIRFGVYLTDLGYKIIDWTDRYSSPYIDLNCMQSETYGHGPAVFMPSQLWLEDF
jgi:hypothetical protein